MMARHPGDAALKDKSVEKNHYIRATFGAMAAYAFTVSPAAGALVLLGHAVYEYAELYLKSGISEQAPRVQQYTDAFNSLQRQAQGLQSRCGQNEIENARRIFFVHNLIEEVCYKAFAEIVAELGITGDAITEEQSGQILAYVKKQAHVELRKDGGYSKTGRQMITDAQFSLVIANIATIVHDRDGRLTDARYTSLTDLCVALDDHNGFIKNLLFKSWFLCGRMHSDTHLPMIKRLVLFNERMSRQVGFDFSEAVKAKQDYFDRYHPRIREIQCPRTGRYSAEDFVNLCEVRGIFSKRGVLANLQRCAPYSLLVTALQSMPQFTQVEIARMVTPRRLSCAARFHKPIEQPRLLDPTLTVVQFLRKYFPERLETNRAGYAPRGALMVSHQGKGRPAYSY